MRLSDWLESFGAYELERMDLETCPVEIAARCFEYKLARAMGADELEAMEFVGLEVDRCDDWHASIAKPSRDEKEIARLRRSFMLRSAELDDWIRKWSQ